ncbi:hypothetical protein BDV96DRAFT_687324 [Lophiotrema nucula]|uniref:TauD/TfdA-like domain-containing protein n=1 Tax=Lophiotrema nucula TaxID=690887 RepID=A0A6A5Z7I7_9PLEO|nr:hypothetical protein BDV96DRAFT_687324 [Lophiotrema nucula]
MTVSDSSFTEFTFAGQQQVRDFGYEVDQPFPLALKAKDDWEPTLDEAVYSIEKWTKSGQLLQLVQEHGGAVLFRGLPVKTADDYSRVAHALGFSWHEEVGRPPLRTVLAPNVKTANEGPPEMPIWPHNEYGWSTINPAWLTFSCLHTPASGGTTPIISSIGLAHVLHQRSPEFFQKLLEKGVRYVYRYGKEEVKSNTGTSVLGAYGQNVRPKDDDATVRIKVEKEVRRHSERFEWHDDGSLSVTHIVPIIRKHVETGFTTWFGNLTSAYGRSRHHGATQPPYLGDDGSYHPLPEYGDGTRIETEYLELALSIAEGMQVDIEWQAGDVVLLDNYAVMHSRRPWTGKRTVLAALWDQKGRVEDFQEGVNILQPQCSSCQCTQCRKWLSSLHPIALTIPLSNLSLPATDSKDGSQLKTFNSSPDCERKFCGSCGSGLTFQNLNAMPDTVELWIGTLDEEVLIGKPKSGSADSIPGEQVEREGGWSQELCQVKETLFWGHRIEGVTDIGSGVNGKKWWDMIGEGSPFN